MHKSKLFSIFKEHDFQSLNNYLEHTGITNHDYKTNWLRIVLYTLKKKLGKNHGIDNPSFSFFFVLGKTSLREVWEKSDDNWLMNG